MGGPLSSLSHQLSAAGRVDSRGQARILDGQRARRDGGRAGAGSAPGTNSDDWRGRVTKQSSPTQAHPTDPPVLHELEAEVMEEVWRRGEVSVREVMDALNPVAPKERAYTTYMTIMARLHVKGMLERRREGKTDFYSPVYAREQYADLRARAEVESVVDQFGELALAHLARQMAHMDPQRRRALQRLARAK